MTFEIVIKSIGALTDPDKISVTKSGFAFGHNVMKMFEENDFIEVYVDTTRRKIGFKSTSSNVTGFKLKRGARASQVANPLTSRRLDKGTYEAKDEDGYVVINVPKILKRGQEVEEQDE